jgi:hypothetical protein
MTCFIICTIRLLLLGWSNNGGWDGWIMWHAWNRWEIYSKFWSENLKGREHLEDLGVYVKMCLEETGYMGVDWIHFGEEMNQWLVLMKMNLRKDSAPWNEFIFLFFCKLLLQKKKSATSCSYFFWHFPHFEYLLFLRDAATLIADVPCRAVSFF